MSRPPREVRPGEELAPRTIGPLSQTDVVRFAGAGGDFNPLHHDPDAARAAGFERPIAMGQLQAGMLAGWLTDTFGVEHLRELTVRFTAPLSLGDTLVLTGRVASVEPDADGVRVGRLQVRAGDGDLEVLRGTASVVVA